jgi:hypothetical protein
MTTATRFLAHAALVCVVATSPARAQSLPAADGDVARLISAMLGDTPLFQDLRALSQEIGGRVTGSPTNARAVDWALQRFRDAGVPVRREAFTMPSLWLENTASATVRGNGVAFSTRVAAMPFSGPTPPSGMTAPLLDVGLGTDADFERVGPAARGAFLFVETQELADIEGLFREYNEAFAIERRAVAAGAAGVAYMGSRATGVLYRHNSSLRGPDVRPMLVMERGAAQRALGLLRTGKSLSLDLTLDLEIGPAYESDNVIGEIRGSTKPAEVVVVGAHLDSWDLGSGALDNGANVALVIDVARQMQRLGIRPARTIRFALWNGEEQGLEGSSGYTKTHSAELDDHVMAMSFDIGCGVFNGFFTGGRPEIVPAVERVLTPVKGLGPFAIIDAPIVGTDNFDFMMHGVANIVANQEPAAYGPSYHAQSDQLEQCDLRSVRINAAIAAALTYGFGTGEVTWKRQTRRDIERLIRATDLEQQMRTFNVWEDWANGTRGRRARP